MEMNSGFKNLKMCDKFEDKQNSKRMLNIQCSILYCFSKTENCSNIMRNVEIPFGFKCKCVLVFANSFETNKVDCDI